MSSDEEEVLRQARNSSNELRGPESQGDLKSIARGLSSTTEIGLLLMQKMSNIEKRVTQIEKTDQRAIDLILDERQSHVELQEEITRTNLTLKKARSERWTKILAWIMTPPGVWGLWELLQKFLP